MLSSYRSELTLTAFDLLYLVTVVRGEYATLRLREVFDQLKIDPGPDQERWEEDPE